MPRISYLPDNRVVDAAKGETILQTSLAQKIRHTHVCGGKARCSTCRVVVVSGLEYCLSRNEKEQAMAERLQFSPEIRLACQTRVGGDITVRRLVLDEADIDLTSQVEIDEGGRLQERAIPAVVGKEMDLAIMFADIRGFTTFSESTLPYDVIHVLNRFFHQMGHIIETHSGAIVNTMGDGLMALFGLDEPTQAPFKSVQAGLEMLKLMEAFSAYVQALFDQALELGVGIHYGTVVVGDLGASGWERMTAIGDSVNFASRVEGANKAADTNFLISEELYQKVCKDVQVGYTTRLKLKGKSGAYTLYEIVGLELDESVD